MDNSKHTCGPWKREGNYIASGCGNYHIALMTIIDEDMKSGWDANQRLIASAPNLLHALETIYANASESPEWIRITILKALKTINH